MDFMTGIHTTKRGNDCVLIVVDRFSKMTHFVPMQKATGAVDFALIFLREIVRLHGLPKRIITDRDVRFTATFWQELMKVLGVKHSMSTAFHLQMDG